MYQSALNALAALTIPGVLVSYTLDTLPETPNRARLPALLALPGDLDRDGLFRERGDGLHQVTLDGVAHAVGCTATHLLLTAPVSAGAGMRSALPGLVTLIDAYIATLAADMTLGGALAQPAQVAIEPGQFTYGGVAYHGCAFRHRWVLAL